MATLVDRAESEHSNMALVCHGESGTTYCNGNSREKMWIAREILRDIFGEQAKTKKDLGAATAR